MKRILIGLLVLVSLTAHAEEQQDERTHYVLTADGRVLSCTKENGYLNCDDKGDFKAQKYEFDLNDKGKKK